MKVSGMAARGSKINRNRGSGAWAPTEGWETSLPGASPACTGLRSLRADAYSRGLEQHSY